MYELFGLTRPYTATGVVNCGRSSVPVGPPTRTPTQQVRTRIWLASTCVRRVSRAVPGASACPAGCFDQPGDADPQLVGV